MTYQLAIPVPPPSTSVAPTSTSISASINKDEASAIPPPYSTVAPYHYVPPVTSVDRTLKQSGKCMK